MKVAFVMIDPMIGKRLHRAGGAIYALSSYLKDRNPYISGIDTKIFNFNSLYTGPLNLYISAIVDYKPDVIGFSTYCWNVEIVKNLIRSIRKLLPDATVILGGPEVSYNSEELMSDHKEIDLIIRGEGEITFNEVISHLYTNKELTGVSGITYRTKNGNVVQNADRPLHPVLDDFPSPFLNGTINLAESDGEVAYETVRGCKFRCSYCLHTKGMSHVREYSLERVEEELRLILLSPCVKIIWFLDPTFNAEEERALKVLEIIERYNPNMPLAFEIRADLLTDRLIEQFGRLNVAEVGIGLQSYSESANKHIHRKNNIEIIEEKLGKLKKAIAHSCEQFDIDLIYGLPGDLFENYKKSVDYILYLGGRIYYQPLRIFKGTQLYNDSEDYGIVFNGTAPYNVLSNSTYDMEQMVSSYCLNVGIDYINRGGIYNDIISAIKEAKQCAYSDILQLIGRYFWDKQAYDIFRVSNWTPDDRSDASVFDDFCQFLGSYMLKENNMDLSRKVREKIDGYLDMEKDISKSMYSQYGYFQLTI
ncbi:radical SAM superfamily enzyme YgiQ (UPF0313 family) [Anaerobacterium chartisolvens]|uniref:Radical SAM superfamily enzyme YgiQ (UPF0313 family) n=1 Tax=Anaerobacterium chartisolvens TaxID=1297424 RepID=A0A369AS08_9FIRM|nr:radical SAM protein [Anaerobacterium chartisolvens]RCX11128.1 radical SAM superfamily enzyme YgiQ (UPF0313 family) [Anaerobacterium chartisolvens]